MSTEPIQPDDCDDETYLAGRAEKYGYSHHPRAGLNPWTNGPKRLSRRKAMVAIGEVLYAARLPDGTIKIGHTTNLLHRFYNFPKAELLAIKAGEQADEVAVHHSLAAYIHHGREWYNPTPEVMAVVNEWRTALGLPEVV